jgi:hypothetical protein
MRVPANEFVGDALDRVRDAEVPGLRTELCDEHGFEQEIAQLFFESGHVVRLDRVQQFAGFLENVRAKRLQRLLAIPRTAIRAAQPMHDGNQAIESGAGRERHARMLSFGVWRLG